ncbi:heparinase II/III family protein [Paenibacillus koleovorans]|uniref:heparinase II/III family protein n=1 Tax=Paenibacillus koleovorans TaxID=121608 RepID=UPI0013E33420|nr:heparinase II/III family protein [Paenibacillus koleovorans]
MNEWLEDIKERALLLLDQPPLDPVTGEAKLFPRIVRLAMMYRLERDSRFASRIWEELQPILKREDWLPHFFLITSVYLQTAALAYDWCYEAWTEEQRRQIREAIVEKGLKPALIEYRHSGPYSQSNWSKRTNNWNIVCNGGVMMAALAIGAEEASWTDEAFACAWESLSHALHSFGPDGGWDEGYAYWNYTWLNMCRAFASMDTALGREFTDRQLAPFGGIAESGYFAMYMDGPTGRVFNYADSLCRKAEMEQMLWLGRRYDNPVYTQWWMKARKKKPGIFPLSLLWFQPSHLDMADEMERLPLGMHFRHVEVSSVRSSWNDSDAVFAAFKAGNNSAPHSTTDMGTFVVDAMGERWIEDFGTGSYGIYASQEQTWTGYWDREWRYKYYVNRAEGHNTLVLNPRPVVDSLQHMPDQNPDGYGPITHFGMDADREFSFGIMDLTSAYADALPAYGDYARTAEQVKRGIALLHGDHTIWLRDELTGLKEPGEVWWFLHINGAASVQLSANGRSAVLSKNGKRFGIVIFSPEADIRFEVMEAKPLPGSPDPEEQWSNPPVEWSVNPNIPTRKLAIHLEGKKDVAISIVMVPLREGQSLPETGPDMLPLHLWTASKGVGA